MKARKRTTSESIDALSTILKSVVGEDPMLDTRDRDVIIARGMFYKIFRDVEHWSFYKIGSIFGRDHATVRNGVMKIVGDMSISQDLTDKYNAAKGMYEKSKDVMESFEVKDPTKPVNKYVYGELIEITSLLKEQNSYIAEIKTELVDLRREIEVVSKRNKEYMPLVDLMLDRLPKSKIEKAKAKMNQVFNGL